jgi:hypothetical protein
MGQRWHDGSIHNRFTFRMRCGKWPGTQQRVCSRAQMPAPQAWSLRSSRGAGSWTRQRREDFWTRQRIVQRRQKTCPT